MQRFQLAALTCVYVKRLYRVYTGKMFDHRSRANDKFSPSQTFLDRVQKLSRIQSPTNPPGSLREKRVFIHLTH